ncbi:hypothetical protein CRE_18892 [Caenorhabditis remanei]|uniref:Uncharacterized protein n=1 Tax=Caenorhabditis remanei TaxID=31234 RepID=E3LJM7_CAERE|nr:hypothetical protein CRE_18892 [Caenorhabditis remanei]
MRNWKKLDPFLMKEREERVLIWWYDLEGKEEKKKKESFVDHFVFRPFHSSSSFELKKKKKKLEDQVQNEKKRERDALYA